LQVVIHLDAALIPFHLCGIQMEIIHLGGAAGAVHDHIGVECQLFAGTRTGQTQGIA
jgi:hypothetical protein